MTLTFWYRNNEHVRATSYRFSMVSCFGGILGYSGVFLLYPIPNDTTCALALWSFRPFRDHFLVKSKLMDANYGPILRCIDLRESSRSRYQTNEVAVKVVDLRDRWQLATATGQPPQLVDDPLREKHMIQTLQATCGHANMVHYQEILEEDNGLVLVFVMEFCGKGDLLHVMLQLPTKRLQEHEALKAFRQIVGGVQFLHAHGIAHRDLLLESIMVTDDNVIKVCDFGLSTKTNQRCRESVGKCYYMAPEMVAGQEYDRVLTDLWSLGMILFILLTNSPLCQLATEDCLTVEIVKRHGVGKILQMWGIPEVASPSTVDLINCLPRVVPSDRLALDQVLEHPALARLTLSLSL